MLADSSRSDVGRSYLGLGLEKKWYGTYSDKPDGKWGKTAERTMLKFAESAGRTCLMFVVISHRMKPVDGWS